MTDSFYCGYIPQGVELGPITWVEQPLGNHSNQCLLLPHLTPAQLQTLGQYIQVQSRLLRQHSIYELVEVIHRCVLLMLDEQQPQRKRVEQALALKTGFDPEMIRLGINANLRSFRKPQLLRALHEDFTEPSLLDRFTPSHTGGWSRALGADLLGVIWAGNVPGIPLWSLCAALLTKSGIIGKLASAEPIMAGWFAHTLAELAPDYAQALAVVWWPGGEESSEARFIQLCDTLVVYGGDHTLQAWQDRCPPSVRFLGHGHKFSAAFVGIESLDTFQASRSAQRLAHDISQWDQQACYAPQTIYVEKGAKVSPLDFAQQLAGELNALAQRFMRQPLSLSQKNQIAAWQQRMDQRVFKGEAITRLGTQSSEWSVVYLDQAHAPEPSPTLRCINVIAIEDTTQLVAQLAPVKNYLQTVAVAVTPERLFDLAEQLGAIGVHRVCAVGATTTPPFGWHHDGRFSLLDLIRMVDIDASAEHFAQDLANYRD